MILKADVKNFMEGYEKKFNTKFTESRDLEINNDYLKLCVLCLLCGLINLIFKNKGEL
jgi:hypothetical protein